MPSNFYSQGGNPTQEEMVNMRIVSVHRNIFFRAMCQKTGSDLIEETFGDTYKVVVFFLASEENFVENSLNPEYSSNIQIGTDDHKILHYQKL